MKATFVFKGLTKRSTDKTYNPGYGTQADHLIIKNNAIEPRSGQHYLACQAPTLNQYGATGIRPVVFSQADNFGIVFTCNFWDSGFRCPAIGIYRGRRPLKRI